MGLARTHHLRCQAFIAAPIIIVVVIDLISENMASAAGYGDNPPPVKRSVAIIHRQLLAEHSKNEIMSEANAAGAISAGRNSVHAIHEQTEMQVQKLYSSHSRGSALATEDIAAREQQLRANAEAESEYVMRQAALKAERCRRLAEMRGEALDQVAENLERQLSDDGKHNGVRLVPQGTNLYVRTYASAPTIRPLRDTHAAVVRVYAQGTADSIDENAAVADKGRYSDDAARKIVRGKILPKPN